MWVWIDKNGASTKSKHEKRTTDYSRLCCNVQEHIHYYAKRLSRLMCFPLKHFNNAGIMERTAINRVSCVSRGSACVWVSVWTEVGTLLWKATWMTRDMSSQPLYRATTWGWNAPCILEMHEEGQTTYRKPYCRSRTLLLPGWGK